MKIVILDAYTVNPGDIDWNELEQLGDVVCYDRTPDELIAERIGDAEVVFSSKCIISEAVMKACPNLKFISALATGYDHIDIDYAKSAGIAVCNVPGYATGPVAQHTVSLILEIANNVGDYNRQVKEGRWYTSPDFLFMDKLMIGLEGKTLGIIGNGSIGRRVAVMAEALGMKVKVYSPHQDAHNSPEAFKAAQQADFVSLHCPVTAENFHFVNEDFISGMKDGAVLINTARGALVDENALAAALKSGKLSAAATDVLSKEPPKDPNPLINCPNCIVTPHIAWTTREARKLIATTSADNLVSYLEGGTFNRIV